MFVPIRPLSLRPKPALLLPALVVLAATVSTLAQTQQAPAVQQPAAAQAPRQNPRLQVPMDPDRARQLYVSKDPAHQSLGANFQRDVDARVAAEARYPELCKGIVDFQKVSYRSSVGDLDIPAYLFQPIAKQGPKAHAAMVWVHGGVHGNWGITMFPFVKEAVERGYVIIAPDYRGSIGYGSAWREGVYMDVGGKDFRDAALSADYLKTLPYVDADRIGAWGLSYGGFFTLLAVTEMPTTFRAAVDVAGVADYAMYYEDPYHGGWTASRIGTPEQNPQVYAQASPLSHVDRLARPLLILHGTADVNVPYLHSVRLIDALLKNGKGDLVEFMTYPGEFHYFTREHVLRDAWTRVDRFFGKWLRPQSPAGRASE